MNYYNEMQYIYGEIIEATNKLADICAHNGWRLCEVQIQNLPNSKLTLVTRTGDVTILNVKEQSMYDHWWAE